MKIELAKENVLKNLTAELEKVENSRGKKTYFFNIGEFVKNAMDAIERQTRLARDREIVKVLENTVMQHVPDDSIQLSHRMLKDFIKAIKR